MVNKIEIVCLLGANKLFVRSFARQNSIGLSQKKSFMSTIMETDAAQKVTKRQFKDQNDIDKLLILQEKDKISTQKATEGAVNHLKQYLHSKNLPNVRCAVPNPQTLGLFSTYFNFELKLKINSNVNPSEVKVSFISGIRIGRYSG